MGSTIDFTQGDPSPVQRNQLVRLGPRLFLLAGGNYGNHRIGRLGIPCRKDSNLAIISGLSIHLTSRKTAYAHQKMIPVSYVLFV